MEAEPTKIMWEVVRYSKLLIHASQCSDENCQLVSCRRIKRFITHIEVCKTKSPKCFICNYMQAFYCYHAKYCQNAECLEPFCSTLKSRLNHEQPQRVQLLRRRIVVLKFRPETQVGAKQNAQQNVNANMSVGVTMKPGMSCANLPSPHQTRIGLKPGTQTPSVHVSQVVKQIQEEAAGQQAPHVGDGKVTPDGRVGVEDGVSGQGGNVSVNKCRRVERSTKLFFHASQCSDANCRLRSCRKIKRILVHIEVCKKKAAKCSICKIMRAFYYHHAKYCKDGECMAPFCSGLKSQSKRKMVVNNIRLSGQVGAIQSSAQQNSNVNISAGVAMKCDISPTNLPPPDQS